MTEVSRRGFLQNMKICSCTLRFLVGGTHFSQPAKGLRLALSHVGSVVPFLSSFGPLGALFQSAGLDGFEDLAPQGSHSELSLQCSVSC